jgi:hypothetical protein
MKPLFVSCTLCLLALGFLVAQTPPITISVPSPNMASAVLSFKGQFAKRYANRQATFPVAGVLSDASAFPATASDTRLLETNADGSLRQFGFASDGSSIESDGRALNGIVFGSLLMGQNFQLPVDFPAHLVVGLKITPSSTTGIDSVTMNFAHSVVLHTENVNLIPNQPQTLYLGTISVSDAGVVYTFANTASAGSDGYVLKMNIAATAMNAAKVLRARGAK